MRTGAQSTLLLAAAAALGGCIVADTSFGAAPSAAALAEVRPGVTTRAELLALLGPPEEYVSPGAGTGLRAHDPQGQRVLEERDLFGRRTLTWVHERRSDRAFVIPILFTRWVTTHHAGRVTALLDERGVVEALGVEPAGDG